MKVLVSVVLILLCHNVSAQNISFRDLLQMKSMSVSSISSKLGPQWKYESVVEAGVRFDAWKYSIKRIIGKSPVNGFTSLDFYTDNYNEWISIKNYVKSNYRVMQDDAVEDNKAYGDGSNLIRVHKVEHSTGVIYKVKIIY